MTECALGYHVLPSFAEEEMDQYPVGKNVSCFVSRENVKYNDVGFLDVSLSSFGLIAFTAEAKDNLVQRFFSEISQS